jgi:hypothetical protein
MPNTFSKSTDSFWREDMHKLQEKIESEHTKRKLLYNKYKKFKYQLRDILTALEINNYNEIIPAIISLKNPQISK